jgi:DNA polymerase-3 subunit delta
MREAIKIGKPGRLYVLHGEERYLRDRTLESLRALIPAGAEGFDYRRFEWKKATASHIRAAVDTPPAVSEIALVEVRDYDMFDPRVAGESDRRQLCEMFGNMPEYACLVFVFDTEDYKPDGRTALAQALKKYAATVNFTRQETPKLVKWTRGHIRRLGADISPQDAAYLVGRTDGYMAAIHGEVVKLASYADGGVISRGDIDAVTAPSPESAAYQLTDAMTRGDFNGAGAVLSDLLRMRESPHKLIYGISVKMRQLLAARILLNIGRGERELMELCDIRLAFQAAGLIGAGRRVTLEECRLAVRFCAETALAMNTGADAEGELVKLLARLAVLRSRFAEEGARARREGGVL